MRIGVFGPSGMLGKELRRVVPLMGYEYVPVSHVSYTLTLEGVLTTVSRMRLDAVINCASILPSRKPDSENMVLMIMVNALLPHLLVNACTTLGLPMVHVSTDRVFSGRGMKRYAIDSVVDARDYFGRSRAVGEVVGPGIRTVRTSFMGADNGFMGWLLNQAALAAAAGESTRHLPGYVNSLWAGGTVSEVAKTVVDILLNPNIVGLQHLATEKTSNKYDLALCIVRAYALPLTIVKTFEPMGNHSLLPTIVLPRVEDTIDEYRSIYPQVGDSLANVQPPGLCDADSQEREGQPAGT